MFSIKSEKLSVVSDNKKITVVKTVYSAQNATQQSENNSVIDSFDVSDKVSEINENAKSDFDVKSAWVNPGGWQSWAPGFEIAPNEKRPSLKNLVVNQWNEYLTVPKTEKAFYKKHIILGQFVMYFRCGTQYFFIASVGNTKQNLPPVQYVYNRKTHNLQIQIYDCGKKWQKDEVVAEICFFVADSFFASRDILKQLFASSEFCGEKCAKRFESLNFLGAVPGGWESWYNHYANINEKLILDDLKSLCETENVVSLMYLNQKKPAVFQIDDGWEETVGAWTIRKDRFPNGLKSISEKIEEKGMIPGLWIAPFLMDLRSSVYAEHPDWILKADDGLPMAAGYNPIWGDKKGPNQPRTSFSFFCLDLSNDEVLDYLDNLIDTAINQWGIRYLKLDFLYAGMMYGKFKNGGAAYEWYYRAVKVLTKRKINSDGKPVAYLGCGMPFEHSFNDFPLSRIGCDTYEHWDNGFMKMIGWNGRTSSYLSMKDTLGRAIWSKAIFLCDPDVMFVRLDNCSLTHDEKIIIATVAILFGNQIMYSDDPATSTSQEEIELTKEIAQIAEKFKDEEFSVTPTDIDVYEIKSRSKKYSGEINLKKRKLVWNEVK